MRLDMRSTATGAAVGMLFVGALWTLISSGTPVAAQGATDQQLSDLRQTMQSVGAQAQRAQVLAVIHQLDSAGLHDLDVSLESGREISGGALGRVRRARVALQAIDWPASLKAGADEVAGWIMKLESAIRNEDWDAAKEPAQQSHDIGHDLSDAVYAWLSGR